MPVYHVQVGHTYDVLIEAADAKEAERRAPSHCSGMVPDRCTSSRLVETADDVKAAGWNLDDCPFGSRLSLQEIIDAAKA